MCTYKLHWLNVTFENFVGDLDLTLSTGIAYECVAQKVQGPMVLRSKGKEHKSRKVRVYY